jgi:HlyD family secretion protein
MTGLRQSAGRWLFWTVVALLALGAVAMALREEAQWVDVAEVRRGPMELRIAEEGKTRVKDRFLLSSPVAGYLHRLDLDVGDPVEAGAVLGVVDAIPASVLDARSRAEARARVEAARAALQSVRQKIEIAQADAELARTEVQRLLALEGENFVSVERLQQARAAQIRAEALLRSARFDEDVAAHELAVARTRVEVSAASSDSDSDTEHVTLRSPVEGAVLRLLRQSEGVVSAGEVLLELGDPSALEVVVDVLSADAVQLHRGMPVRLSGWGGEALDALVRRVEPVGFVDVSALGVEEQRVRVILDIASPRESWQSLGDGYRVDAAFLLWQSQDVLQVPASSVFDHGGRPAGFRVSGDRVTLQPVDVGRSNGLETQVLDGLQAGERVVRHPSRQLDDGVRVRER